MWEVDAIRGGDVGVGVFDLGLVGADPTRISDIRGSGLVPAATVSRFDIDLDLRLS